MGKILNKFDTASGGYSCVQEDWISATALRPLIHEDPCLVWLQHHGAKHGFTKDPDDAYSFLKWIGDKGRQFESAWVRNVAGPDVAVQVLTNDHDVRSADGLRQTLKAMESGAQVLTKAGLWWAPERVYGSADILCRASWLYKTFPHLRPKKGDAEPDYWVVIDCKFQSGLHDDASKRHDYEAAATQVRLYSYIVGQLTGTTPRRAYLATRDCPLTLVPVEVSPCVEGRLSPEIAGLRDQCLDIKLNGAEWRPWEDCRVAPNFMNSKNAPWSQAVKQMREYYAGGPLEILPAIGAKQARSLRAMGYNCVDDVLAAEPDAVEWTEVSGIGASRAIRLRAVLEAARSGSPSDVPVQHVPAKADVELFVDFEYLTNADADFDTDWPALSGREMVFMAGVGWEKEGTFRYKQLAAEWETPEAERDLFGRLLKFLKSKGVFDSDRSAALYHWSAAEVWQAKRAAERHGLPQVASLPWCDLRQTFVQGAISVPGAYGLGIKEVAHAIGQLDSSYKIEWPADLADGLSAMVMGWIMYARGREIIQSPELDMLTTYLQADVRALHTVLRWLRASSTKCRKTAVVQNQSTRWWASSLSAPARRLETSFLGSGAWYRNRAPGVLSFGE